MMLFHMSADEFATAQTLKREGMGAWDVARALKTGDYRLEWETTLLTVERPVPVPASDNLFWTALRMI